MAKYRVYYAVTSPRGFDKTDIKMFNQIKRAKSYTQKLVAELKEQAKETDDPDHVVIENVKTDEVINLWKNDNGKVVKFK